MNQQQAEALADRINKDFGNLSAYTFVSLPAKRWYVGVIGLLEEFASHQQYDEWFADMVRDGDDYHMGRHAAG